MALLSFCRPWNIASSRGRWVPLSAKKSLEPSNGHSRNVRPLWLFHVQAAPACRKERSALCKWRRFLRLWRAWSRRAKAEEIFAICIRLSAPSCMRAPPEDETTTRAERFSSDRSMARVIFSPTTEPIDPPMKLYSMADKTTGTPSMCPSTLTTASRTPTFSGRDVRLSLYGLVELNSSGSVRSEEHTSELQSL